MRSLKTYLPDEAATLALGASLAQCLAKGLLVYLHGDLGAGKTALTRACLHAAGYVGAVKSPTYTLVEHYRLPSGQQVLHFDLYRMGSPEEFLDAGFAEELNGDNICLIEWPSQAAGVLPPPDVQIYLRVAGDGREVELQACSHQGELCLNRLHFAPTL